MRSRADRTPTVTVFSRPRGLPMAITVSPIIRSSCSAGWTKASPLRGMRNSARSASVSEPITSASASLPSAKRTLTSAAPSMTCSLVTIRPSFEITTPVPSACDEYTCPSGCRSSGKNWSKNSSKGIRRGAVTTWRAVKLTTAGRTFSTTWTTGVLRPPWAVVIVVDSASGTSNPHTRRVILSSTEPPRQERTPSRNTRRAGRGALNGSRAPRTIAAWTPSEA